jgi:hypothetical protein
MRTTYGGLKTVDILEIEQQISYLIEKTQLSDAEAQVLNTVGNTLRSKYQQDNKRQILRTKSERQCNNNNPVTHIFIQDRISVSAK